MFVFHRSSLVIFNIFINGIVFVTVDRGKVQPYSSVSIKCSEVTLLSTSIRIEGSYRVVWSSNSFPSQNYK